MRTGIGCDTHGLVSGRALVLGGIRIDFPLGLRGHSDADVLTHAIIDALLGAAGLGDIGEHFPDTDPAYERADSCKLLADVVGMIAQGGFAINNVDAIIIAEKPKLTPYKPRIREHLAQVMRVDAGRVNIKAKTAEGMGPEGQGHAITAWATATLIER